LSLGKNISKSNLATDCNSQNNDFICLTKYKDMSKEYLGEFEELILTLVAALQDDAYGAAIAEEIETKLKREVNLSAVHVTLYRLEDKGHIKSSMGGGTKERGGRRKRIYTITSAGMAMLRAMKESRIELWKMVPQLKMSAT
jgi:DNA-binding PadR family transcriptional regulator